MAASTPAHSTHRRWYQRIPAERVRVWGLRILAGFAGLLIVLFVASYFLDEPIRRTMERNMNRHLEGYSVQLPRLHFQLIGLSVTLENLTISQKAHPRPPVAVFPVLKAHLHWKGLLFGRLVAEFELDQPQLHVDLPQLVAEAQDTTPVKNRGWQQALEDIYPLKINHFVVNNGDLVYIDSDSARPLHLSRVNMEAENIRNVHLANRVYPSSFHMESVIFETGRGSIEGNANFLAEPIPAIKAGFRVEQVPLDYFKPVLARYNLAIEQGQLATSGMVEYGPTIKNVHIADLTLDRMALDYIHTPVTATSEKQHVQAVGHAAGKASNSPTVELRLDHMRLSGTFGMINRGVKKPYRVFISDADFEMTNLSNHFSEGPAQLRVTGRFMGSGPTLINAEFRPETNGPDFDVTLSIRNTRLRSMNDMLRAYGNFDVSAGLFSFYTELHIKNQRINGYVKPLFRNLKVYDKRQDREKSLFHKMYEMLVGGVASLLKNQPRSEVATRASISGPIEAPHTNTWQVIDKLIQNAFFKAILPGFERQVTARHP